MPTTICLSLLKRSTEPEISFLLWSASLVTLREWCEKALVKPIGPLNHKASLSVPLSTTFLSYYCNLATMDVTVLRSAAREIGSRSTAVDGCLYDLLQTRFPMDLLQKRLKVKHVDRSAVTRAARSTAVDQRKSILKVGDWGTCALLRISKDSVIATRHSHINSKSISAIKMIHWLYELVRNRLVQCSKRWEAFIILIL